MLADLGVSQKHIMMHCDSQSAICLAKNQVFHARTKYIVVQYHFVREILEEGEILLQENQNRRKSCRYDDKGGASC